MNLRILSGALVLSFPLGALHAYSVLVDALEQATGGNRASVSAAYSLAILSLALGVLFGPRILTAIGPRRLAFSSGGLCGLGLALAGFGGTIPSLILGYGLLFGFANGLGYSLFLNEAAAASPARQGIAIGLVTAVYGIGAMVFSGLLGFLLAEYSLRAAFLALMLAALLGACYAGLAFPGRAPGAIEPTRPARRSGASVLAIGVYWMIYFCGATGGLMAIAHAAPILALVGSDRDMPTMAPILLAIGNCLGALGGGRLGDIAGPRLGLGAILALSCLALILSANATDAGLLLATLAVIGICYGALIAIIPVLLRKTYGDIGGAQMFARVFTAWGAAGILGPGLAGWLFDTAGNYQMALLVASGASFLGLILVVFIPKARRQ